MAHAEDPAAHIQAADLDAAMPGVRECLREAGARLLLSAPPGTGKTTGIPLALMDADWLDGQTIVMLEPRRIAARAAAARMAELLGEEPGDRVGYRVRFDTRVSAATRVEVVTEGLLVRRLQHDPELAGVGLVIFDEIHERHLDTDLALALTLDAAAGLRPDLRILAMSATLPAERLRTVLAASASIDVSGEAFPVETQYLGPDTSVVAAVRRAADESTGDLLVFLPGAREIQTEAGALSRQAEFASFAVVPLYGELGAGAEQAALRPDAQGRRKIVLATNIAESSLTIPGVTAVVDSGLARAPRYDPNASLARLQTVRIAQSSAVQRQGRAGRTGPGRCYRLWTESDHNARARYPSPEIQHADLAPLKLQLHAWGASDASMLAWPDMPPQGALAQADELLESLGALDARRRLTSAGQAMAGFPAHPRLAALVQFARNAEEAAIACRVAAIVSEGSPWRGPRAQQPVDLGAALDALASRTNVDRVRCDRIARTERSLRWAANVRADCPARLDGSTTAALERLLLLAFADRIAVSRGREERRDAVRFLMANGRAVIVADTEPLATSDWLIVVDAYGAQTAGGNQAARVSLAVATSLPLVRDVLAERVHEEQVVAWDDRAGVVVAERRVSLGALTLEAEPLADAGTPELTQATTDAMVAGIRTRGLAVLPWTDKLAGVLARARLMHAREVGGLAWPDVSEQSLLSSLETWLGPFLENCTRLSHLQRVRLDHAIATLLPWPLAGELDRFAPTHLEVPSGRRAALRYDSDDGVPVLPVLLQEMYGTADTPSIGEGRIPVRLELLSPARRPLHVTQNLGSFWDDAYQHVRKEMRGRYPKHDWPEDPRSASPARGARRRKS